MVTQAPDGMIEFAFFRPHAHRVFLAGDFNEWQESFILQKDQAGWWRCRLHLAPGIYQFRYQADGHWFNDYASFGLEKGPLGWNSVVKVEKNHGEQIGLEAA